MGQYWLGIEDGEGGREIEEIIEGRGKRVKGKQCLPTKDIDCRDCTEQRVPSNNNNIYLL